MSNIFTFCGIYSAWMSVTILNSLSKTKLISDDLHPSPCPLLIHLIPRLPLAQWPFRSGHPYLKSCMVFLWVFFLLILNQLSSPIDSASCLTSHPISVTSLITHPDPSPNFLPCLITHSSFLSTSCCSWSRLQPCLKGTKRTEEFPTSWSGSHLFPENRDRIESAVCQTSKIMRAQEERMKAKNVRSQLALVTNHFQLGLCTWIWPNPWTLTLISSFASMVSLPPTFPC